MVVKKICEIKTNLSEIRKALNLPPASSTEFRRCLCVAIYTFWNHKAKRYGIKTTSYGIKTTSYGIKTTSYGIKTTSYGIKTSSYAHKTTSYAHKTTSYAFKTYKFDSWNQLKLISYNFLKRCFECTVNGSLQMVVGQVVSCKRPLSLVHTCLRIGDFLPHTYVNKCLIRQSMGQILDCFCKGIYLLWHSLNHIGQK